MDPDYVAEIQVRQQRVHLVAELVLLEIELNLSRRIGKMREGQPVELIVDAYPDKVFKGHVDSIQAGTGARFSMLPAENATGNYVKVVQRVPVRIEFEPNQLDPNQQLAPGMSVTPEVQVR